MNFENRCVNALKEQRLFEDMKHLSRFRELISCYGHCSFFNKGLCKCMYMSAWDDEHFAILIETLNNLILGKERDTKEMVYIADSMADESANDDYYMYQLSISFVQGKEFVMDKDIRISSEARYIMNRSLLAASVIDGL